MKVHKEIVLDKRSPVLKGLAFKKERKKKRKLVTGCSLSEKFQTESQQ